MDSGCFSRRERAAVLWADHVARNTAYDRDDIFEEVRSHFNDAGLVELTGVCGYFALNNRFQDSLHLPLEEPDEVDKIRLSVRGDPERLKTFLDSLLDEWPEDAYDDGGRQGDAGGPNAPRRPPGGVFADALCSVRHAAEKRGGSAPSRVPLLDAATACRDGQSLLRAVEALLGAVPNSARVWAHVPHIGKMFFPFYFALEREGAGGVLSGRLKAMALVTTARAQAAPSGLAQYGALARAAGLSERQIAELCWADPPGSLSGPELAVVEWARAMASNAAKRNAAAFRRLEQHFTIPEIVELTGLCATANMATLMYNALRLPPDEPPLLAGTAYSVRMDPYRIKDYLGTIRDQWPGALPLPESG